MVDIKVLGSGSSGNAYLLSDGDSRLLLEAGLPYSKLQKLLDYQLTHLDGVLVSHEHGDHARAAKKIARAGVNVYMSQGTKDALDPNEHRFRIFSLELSGITYELKKIGNYAVWPFKIIHDAREPIGFYIYSIKTKEKIIFVTDTEYCPCTFEEEEIDIFMVEVNYQKEILNSNTWKGECNLSKRCRTVKNHMSLSTAIAFLHASHADKESKAIYLMHLSDTNSNEEEIRRTMTREFPKQEIHIC